MVNISKNSKASRFIFDSDGFKEKNDEVTPKSFMPKKISKNPVQYEEVLSVFINMINGSHPLDNDQIWHIGLQDARDLKARADICVDTILNIIKLKVIPQPIDQNEYHAHITPFPSGRLECYSLASKLAFHSKLKVYST